MKNRKKEKDCIPTLTIFKVFVMFALILALRLNVDILLLNLLLIISAIEILATNYKKSGIKWSIIIFELYAIMLCVPLQNMKSPETIFSSLLYVLIVIISIVVDFSIYIEKV